MKNGTYLSIGILTLIFIVILFFGTPKIINLNFDRVLTPLWSASNKSQRLLNGIVGFFKRNDKLRNDISILEEKLDSLSVLSLVNKELKIENNNLKSIAGRADAKDQKLKLANILRGPNQLPYDILILDIGNGLGVSIGNKVYVDGNIIIGEIVEVGNSTAKVRLFSTWGTDIQVAIGENKIKTTAQGRNGGNFLIELPRDADVKLGDIITIPDINLSILGIVGAIEADPEESSKKIYFRNPVNLNNRSWVEIEI